MIHQPMTDPDADLVLRARTGDRDALACLLERHLPLMRRVCQRLLGTSDGLDDIAQEAALQAMLGLDSLRDGRQFGAWLAGIGLNVARRSRRTRAVREAWSYEALLGGRLISEPVEDGPGPLEQAEAMELASAISAAVSELPPGQRVAVLLVYLSGLSYRETAAALGVEVGAVKTRLHKGRIQLQHRLRDLWKEQFVTTSVDQDMVEMSVADVRQGVNQDDKPALSVVILEEIGGPRQVPIWIGHWEGDSIAMLLQRVQVPRPLTHAFTTSLLRAGGLRVRQVRINRLAEETFYSQVMLDGPTGEHAVDARPSDAIALAVEMGAPIYAAHAVVAACEALRATRGGLPTTGIGAAEIVSHIVEHWPSVPRPTT